MTEIAKDYTAKLPVETIGEIFKLVFDYNIQEYDLNTTSSFPADIPLILGAVATRWRDITLNMPHLWTFIQLDLRKYVKGDDQVANEAYLLSYLRRSGNKPLRLAIVALAPHQTEPDFYSQPWATVNSTVYPISLIPASQIFTFYLRSHVPLRWGYHRILLVLEFPSFKKLDINASISSEYCDVVLNTSRLQSFHLDNCAFNPIGELPHSLATLLISTMRLAGAPDMLSAPGVESLYLRDSDLDQNSHCMPPERMHTWPDSVASWRLGAGSGGALSLLGVASTATRRA